MKKPVPVPTVAKLTPAQRADVDAYVEARARWKSWQPPVNPHAARYNELQVKILAWFEKESAEAAFIAEGVKYRLPVTMRKNKRTLKNIAALFRKLGQKWVAEHCEPTLDAVEHAIAEDKLDLYIDEERTGSRTLGEPVAMEQKETAKAK